MLEWVTMAGYSLLLGCVLLLGSPYWLWRLARGERQVLRVLAERLGRVPRELREAVKGRQVIWLHAVSVGEVLAATRLVAELEKALGDGWSIVVSTTTATGQALARRRLGGGESDGTNRVFYYPLDFAWAVRAYLRALRPGLLVLMESELWPRMLAECRRAGIPVAVVNARVSDRSFTRGLKVRAVWGRLLRRVSLFLAQSEQDAERLVAMKARPEAVRAVGNLKYDAAEPRQSRMVERIRAVAEGRPVIVAGSTVAAVEGGPGEEAAVIGAWRGELRTRYGALLVLAPRHPERFEEGARLLSEFRVVRASEMQDGSQIVAPEAVLLDTIGDLAGVYQVASVAFIGGSIVPRGGHNPLEAARFGVPVITGPSTSNFREIYGRLAEAKAVAVLKSGAELEITLMDVIADADAARAMGERGRRIFEEQQGATARTVEALLQLIGAGAGTANDGSAE